MDSRGNIRQLQQDEKLREGETALTSTEAAMLAMVEEKNRVEVLRRWREKELINVPPTPQTKKQVSKRNNSKHRKEVAVASRALNLQAKPRCLLRDKDGHRCMRAPHISGNHKAFGKEWQ